MKSKPLTSPACPTSYPLPNDPASNQHVISSPPELFKYFKINGTTQACSAKKTEEKRDKCFQRFLDLDKKLSRNLKSNP